MVRYSQGGWALRPADGRLAAFMAVWRRRDNKDRSSYAPSHNRAFRGNMGAKDCARGAAEVSDSRGSSSGGPLRR